MSKHSCTTAQCPPLSLGLLQWGILNPVESRTFALRVLWVKGVSSLFSLFSCAMMEMRREPQLNSQRTPSDTDKTILAKYSAATTAMRPQALFLPSILLAAFSGLVAGQDNEPDYVGTAILKEVSKRGSAPTPTCATGNFLCVYFAGQSCINVNGGDTCCVDGSGICSNGFECGTGVAAGRCCQSGITPAQCAAAVIVGTATTRPPVPSPTKTTKTKAAKHTTTKHK
ncbi:hypothetical protein EDD37DRAFT_404036 [Exophiala viscosa]|uniref:Uncharacterized protein n=1 Tax=Exophiala viscosa TaxID=2486360 RepID=A0AAN6E0C3_9EURO|nr:hypothetical protein EDD36DRAFT_167988 [Exophiala viscosa]KAI1624214.1 hypothetical protein EDD37DRAFT_404036 [Exophiala viscosa]